jgi:hypothetical protein
MIITFGILSYLAMGLIIAAIVWRGDDEYEECTQLNLSNKLKFATVDVLAWPYLLWLRFVVVPKHIRQIDEEARLRGHR